MYAVLNLNMTPHEWCDLPQRERAFYIACIDLRLEAEKRERAKIKT